MALEDHGHMLCTPRQFLSTRYLLIEVLRATVLLLDSMQPVPVGSWRLLDVGPLLLSPSLEILTRGPPTAHKQAIYEVASDICPDKPQPRQGGEPERDDQRQAEDKAGNADPEEGEGDGGRKSEGGSAEDERGEEEDGDEGEEELGDDEGLSYVTVLVTGDGSIARL